MRIINRKTLYNQLFNQLISFPKVTQKSIYFPQGEVSLPNFQDLYSGPLQPFSVAKLQGPFSATQEVQKKKLGKGKVSKKNKSLEAINKEEENYKEINSDQNRDQIYQAKKSKKSAAKVAKKSGSQSHQKKQKIHLEQPNTVEQKFPALNYLKQALMRPQPEAQQSFGWNQKNGGKQSRQTNSQQFMQLISHSLAKQSCQRVVKIVEKYTKKMKEQPSKSSKQSKPSNKAKRSLEEHTYQQIKLTLQKELILTNKMDSSQESTQTVHLFLSSLKNTNPESITMQILEGKYFMDQSRKNQQYNFNFNENQQIFTEQKSGTKKDENKSLKKMVRNKDALQKALKLKTKSINSIQNPIKSSQAQNQPIYDIRLTPQNLIFNQLKVDNPSLDPQQNHKYAYIYDLPYNITQQDAVDLVAYLQQFKHINITQFAVFPYKELVSNERYEVKFSISQEEGGNKMKKVYEASRIDQYLSNPNKAAVKSSKKNEKKILNLVQSNDLDEAQEVLEEQEYLSPSTDAILNKIRKQDYSRFNRSSMVIKMATVKDKDEILTHWTRLFGLNFKHLKNIKFEEAHPKTMLVLSGIPTGCKSSAITEAINKGLQDHKMRIEVDEDCYLTKNYILIEFQSFVETLTALQTLNNLEFQGKTLKTNLKYGPMQLSQKCYKTFSERIQTWQKITEVTQNYIQKYEQEDEIVLS